MNTAGSSTTFDLERIVTALGPTPKVAYAAAHAYPASAPAFVEKEREERARPAGDSLRLYAHVPYCNYRCSFCFFAVQVGASRQDMNRYVQALKRELTWLQPGTTLSQLFVGGGTPTALPSELLDELLESIFQHCPPRGDNMHVVEASPESLTPAHVAVVKRRDIGRISMGIQSLSESVLEGVKRRHTAQQTLDACSMVIESGLLLNIDLMYGLPGQTHEDYRRDFLTLVNHGVQSITVYDLRLNERTPVANCLEERERLEIANLLGWRLFVRKTAEEAGFSQTRWHTFKRLDTIARNHQRAPHHDKTGCGFQLGIGMSARSHLGATVYRNHDRSRVYLERIESNQSPVQQIIELQEDDRKTLYVTSSIGDGRPLDMAEYERTFGATFIEDFEEPLNRLITGGLVAEENGSLHLTEAGRLLYDRVTFNFYPRRILQWLAGRSPNGMGVATSAL